MLGLQLCRKVTSYFQRHMPSSQIEHSKYDCPRLYRIWVPNTTESRAKKNIGFEHVVFGQLQPHKIGLDTENSVAQHHMNSPGALNVKAGGKTREHCSRREHCISREPPGYYFGKRVLLVECSSRWPWSDVFSTCTLSDMSPATSDCLEPYFSVGFYFYFPIIACVLTFLGPFISF